MRSSIERLLLVVLLSSLLGACAGDVRQELRECEGNVERLERISSSAESEVERLSGELTHLELELRKAQALLVGSRMGMLDASTKLYATIETDAGRIVVELFWTKAPYNVQNFVELAEGGRDFTDPKTGQQARRPFFDGLIFHRVIKGFMIQGGDPLGTGEGGPGYTLPDEFDRSLRFSRPGMVAMANSAPNTNGSQFFITVSPQPQLNDKYTIIGEVVEGMPVVKDICTRQTGEHDRPIDPVTIKRVAIERRLADG